MTKQALEEYKQQARILEELKSEYEELDVYRKDLEAQLAPKDAECGELQHCLETLIKVRPVVVVIWHVPYNETP